MLQLVRICSVRKKRKGISDCGQITPMIVRPGEEENTYHWGQYAATVIDPTNNLISAE
jgi:hypothetical protein